MLVRAAVQLHLLSEDRDITIPVHRHCDAYLIMQTLGYGDSDYVRVMEGFLTDAGDFLDRCAAFDHAAECGQIDLDDPESDFMFQMGVLFSEDLW